MLIESIQDFFLYGMDREIASCIKPPLGPKLNLAPGDKKKIPGTVGVGPRGNFLTDEEWYAGDPLPFGDGSVAEVHAYHFLEHLDGELAIDVLKEIDRVLKPGGVAQIVTPYYNSSMQAHALDHKSAWNEGTWQWLFSQEFYNDYHHSWGLKVNFCLIIGIVERNLCLMTQLVQTGK